MKTVPSASNQRTRNRLAAPLVAAVLGAASLGNIVAAEQKPQTAAKQSANTKEIVMPVDGMSCVACVARVKKAVSGMRGVAAVNVDLAERNARISFDPKRVSARELAAAIDKLGYKAGEPKDAATQKNK